MSFRKICVECGQRRAINQHLCRECFAQAHPIVAERYKLKIPVCNSCYAIQASGLWSQPQQSPQAKSFAKILEQGVVSVINRVWSLNYSSTITILNSELISISNMPRPVEIRGICHLEGQPDVFSSPVEEEHLFSAELKWITCEDCQAIRTGSYQAKVQIRGLRDNEIDAFANEIADIVEKLEGKDVSGAFITKIESVKRGLDLYLGSKKLALEISKHFRSFHCSEIVQTAESTGGYDLQRSCFRYRTVISIRLPSFREGDVIEFQSQIFQVEQFLSGSRVRLCGLRDYRTAVVEISQLIKNSPRLVRNVVDLETFQILSFEESDVALVQRQSDFETLYVRFPSLLVASEGDLVWGITIETDEILLVPLQRPSE